MIARYLDVGRLDMKNSFSGPLSDNNPAIIRYFYGTDELSGDAKSALGELCKSTGNLAQKIVVSGFGGNDSYYGQMLSWLQTRNITEYLGDTCGIQMENLIFQYAQPGEPGTVEVRLAKEGEDGPPMAAPPISGNIEPY